MPLPIPPEFVGAINAPPAVSNATLAPQPTSTSYLSVPPVIQNGTNHTKAT